MVGWGAARWRLPVSGARVFVYNFAALHVCLRIMWFQAI